MTLVSFGGRNRHTNTHTHT